ncbi:tyrosine-type recombinase/integrase [Nocardioides dokdonensis]|uniref:tyrosine-type recombinase/integrase n=1 Tax=Nocardioides dokdonensis TaxID=450734 RepID=UPI000A06ED65|nr:site-specific integrase [Nocardioides dokdonensis]
MSSIKRRDSGKWRARYRDADGKEHARHFERKVDAQRWLDEVTASILTGNYVDPKAGKITFEVFARQWQLAQVHRPNTAAAVDSALRVHAFPAFGGRQIASIKPSDIQNFVHTLTQRLAPSTVRVTYQHVRAVFRAAEADRLIARSPCQRISLPRVERRVLQPLPSEVVIALEGAMPHRWAAMIPLMAGTGIRPGEAAGLSLDRVDFLRRTVRIDRQLLLTWPPTHGPPKTRSSIRTIPLPQVVVNALAAHVAQFPVGENEAIFTNTDGSLLKRDHVSAAFRRAVTASGAPAQTRLHDLRHYYASLLIRHGESVKVVQSRLGHSSASETLDTYSHLWPDSEDMTRQAIDTVLGAQRAGTVAN